MHSRRPEQLRRNTGRGGKVCVILFSCVVLADPSSAAACEREPGLHPPNAVITIRCGSGIPCPLLLGSEARSVAHDRILHHTPLSPHSGRTGEAHLAPALLPSAFMLGSVPEVHFGCCPSVSTVNSVELSDTFFLHIPFTYIVIQLLINLIYLYFST